MKGVQVAGKIIEKPESREVTLKTGQKAKVADLTLADETGKIKLTLWDEQINKVNVGDRVRIENGYVNSYKGELRLNVGRYGKLIVEKE